MKFEKMKRAEQERFLMPILIKLLQNLGGKASRKELRNEIRTSVSEIPEAVIDETKPTKNGGIYHPFNFVFNFSITNLEMADFLTCPQRGEVVLTEKGRQAEAKHIDVDKEIYALSIPLWEERKNQNNKKKNVHIDVEGPEMPDADEQEDEEIGGRWKETVRKALLNMPAQKFELFCRALVKAMGVDIDEKKGVSATRDGGIDGYGYIVSDDFRTARVAIQAKRWHEKQKVRAPDIDQFVGAMLHHNAEFGIFITTADFTRDAIERSRSGQRPITLINGEKIIELVEKYQLYIKPVTTYEPEPFYFEEH